MTQFTLDIDASNGTSNLSYLLEDELHDKLRDLSPAKLMAVFGPGDDLCYEPARGYDAPEWYWQSSDGSVWGIGWRWGSPRLRGRGGQQRGDSGLFWVHPTREAAAEFVEFLCHLVSGGDEHQACNLK